MQAFLIRRLFTSILTLLFVTALIFGISRTYGDSSLLLLPDESYGLNAGDMEVLKKRLHLDDHVVIQYFYWIGGLLRGDLGIDLADRRPIGPKLAQKFMPTLQLAGAAWLLATVIGIPLGVLSAVKRGTVWDLAGRWFAVLGHSLPAFWIAIVSILIFSVWLRWFPAGTAGFGQGFSIKYYVLPTAILAWLPMAGYMRLVRSSMLEVLDSEYIRLARAKGVSYPVIIWKHAFRNSIIAPITFGGMLLAGLINGSIAVETIFAWPGIARWAVESVWNNNVTVLALVTLIFTLGYVVANFLVDVIYVLVDPRIRY